MNFKKITSLFLAALVISSATRVFASTDKINKKIIYGQNRYEISIEISKSGWQKSSYVIVCRGDNFPDALCSVPLAKKYNVPILLIQNGSLNDNIKREIRRLSTQNIIIWGTGVIDSKVEKNLKSIKGINTVTRLGGKDRYETSQLIAKYIGNKEEVVVTTGKCPADALSMSSIAANKEIQIILVNKKEIIKRYVKENTITKSYVIGGTSCVSKDIEDMLPNSERIYGQNRYETNENIIKRFNDDIDYKKIYLALAESERGDEFADALTGGALASKENNPIILVGESINKSIAKYIYSKLTNASTVIVLGGEKIIPDSIVNEIENISTSKILSKNKRNSRPSSLSNNELKSNKEYKISIETSFQGAFTYDVKVTESKGELLKGYNRVYDGKIIAEDKNNDGITRPLSIFLGKDIDNTKLKIVKNGQEIKYTGLNN